MRGLLTLGLVTVLSTPAMLSAQQKTAEAEKTAEKEKKPEKIEVTGSRIRRLDVEGPSPITTIDSREIKDSGVESLGDLLRDQTFNTFGSRREKTGGNFFAEANVDLRGLGVGRTLVLLNGKRIAKRAGTGGVDLNLIPLAAVERVEILRDGASAIYGTDAVGGVINIITKKDFEGASASVALSLPEKGGGESRTFSFYQGTASERSSTTTMVSFSHDSSIAWTQRPKLINHDNTKSYGGRGSYKDAGGAWVAFPDCPEDKVFPVTGGTRCGVYYADESIVLPEVKSLSILNTFKHQLTDDIQMFGGLWAMRKESEYHWGPFSLNASRNFSVSKGAAKNMVKDTSYATIFDSHPGDVTLEFQMFDAGPEERQVEATLFGGGIGLKGTIFSDWDWEVYYTEDRDSQTDTETSGAVSKRVVEELMNNGKYNPFAQTAEARGSLEDARVAPSMITVNYSREVSAQISGTAFKLFDKPVQTAIGISDVSDSFVAKNDPVVRRLETDGQSFNGGSFSGYSGGGARKVSSAFAEFNVPVATGLEFQIAGRYDKYNDFGSTMNPKLAVRYAPIPSVYLRGSAGTGFRAPTLDELYRDKYQQYTSYTDKKLCPTPDTTNPNCSGKTTYITAGGNKELSEEGSEAFSYGIGYEPIKNVALTADYWSILVKNVIGFQNLTSLTEAEGQGYDIRKYASITRDGTTGLITSVVALNQNLGRKEARGVDYSANYKLTTDQGKFDFTSTQSSTLTLRSKDWAAAPLVEQVGKLGKPKWRNRSFVRWDRNEYSSTVSMSTIGPQKNDGGNVAAYNEWGLFGKYRSFWNAEISAGVQNVFNKPVPVSLPSTPSINDSLYSYLGRRLIVEYTQNF